VPAVIDDGNPVSSRVVEFTTVPSTAVEV